VIVAASFLAAIGDIRRFQSPLENDGLNWPHCDGLNWPHLRPIVA